MTIRSVMFVDDEPAVLAALARLFQRYNEELYVFVAADAQDALAKLQMNPIDLVVTDFRMPGMNGIELLDEVSRLYPNTRGAILSGHAEVRLMLRARQGKPLPPFFSKPWDNQALRRAVCKLLGLARHDEEADEAPSQAAA